MHIDLTMWAKDGAHFLPLTLKRIDEVIPKENVGQKIFIDDNSIDESASIAKDFSWDIYKNLKGGIGNGANLALSKVRTPLFASFEQDVILNRYWFDKIFPKMEKSAVAVAQGWRLSTNTTLKALEEFGMEWFGKIPLYSLDNNLFKTNAVRAVGGFPINVNYCVDGVLRAHLQKAGWHWITDRSVLSVHIKPFSIFDYARRYDRMSRDTPIMLAEGLLLNNEIKKLKLYRQIIKIIYSPIIGGGLAITKHDPFLFLYYPLVRLFRLKGFISGRANLNSKI
jgi:hypothetical protein